MLWENIPGSAAHSFFGLTFRDLVQPPKLEATFLRFGATSPAFGATFLNQSKIVRTTCKSEIPVPDPAGFYICTKNRQDGLPVAFCLSPGSEKRVNENGRFRTAHGRKTKPSRTDRKSRLNSLLKWEPELLDVIFLLKPIDATALVCEFLAARVKRM